MVLSAPLGAKYGPPSQRTAQRMKRFNKGDRVRCRGEFYYVVGGPSNASLGYMYDLSKIPPDIRVLENEMEPALEEGDLPPSPGLATG